MEHLHHFGLPQDPFSNEPDLRYFFESGTHRDAQRRVERGLRQHKGLTVLTGEGGMGKTLLARRILESLEEEVFEATLLVMLPGAADATGILQRFARQLGCDEPAADRAGLLGQIYEQLAIVREDGRHAVLMIDDAQVMTPPVFAELGGLLSLEYEDRRLVSMLFVGSPELDSLIQNDPSISPRVDVRVRLDSLDMENAAAYLAHRITAVNGNPEVVPAAAMDTLFKLGRGRPRLMNTLADNALFEAYLAGRPTIDPSDVERAAADLGVGPDPGQTFSKGTPSAMAAPAAVAAPIAMDEAPEAMAVVQPLAASTPMAAVEPLAAPEPMAEVEPLATVEPGALEAFPESPAEPAGDFDLAAEMNTPISEMADLTGSSELEEEFGGFRIVGEADAAPLESIELEAAPLEDAVEEASVVEDGMELVLEAELLGEADAEPGFVLAEAELSPLGEGDELDGAFVELLEE